MVMTTPPTRWLDRLLSVALTVLVIAVLLYIAARLVLAVLPVLIGMAVVVFIGFVFWLIYGFRGSRW
jgi:xanthine/uracil permease